MLATHMSREGKYNISTFFYDYDKFKTMDTNRFNTNYPRIFKNFESPIHPSKEDVLLVQWAISDNKDYIYTGQVKEY